MIEKLPTESASILYLLNLAGELDLHHRANVVPNLYRHGTGIG